MDIPAHLVDTTTLVKDHTMYTHLGCVALRCFLGLYFLLKYQQTTEENIFFVVLFGALLFFFLFKFIHVKKTWKVFLRTVITMALAIPLLLGAEKQIARAAIGLLLIVDALMGLQSRYVATLLRTF